ncbi:Hypothetical protein FKW44_017468, partial [Caligus rogercresseyi]
KPQESMGKSQRDCLPPHLRLVPLCGFFGTPPGNRVPGASFSRNFPAPVVKNPPRKAHKDP